MTTNALKFYRQSAQPTEAAVGAIWFDVTNRTIQVYTSKGWEPYAGKLQNAEWDTNKQKLSITKHDGSKIELDFSDMASASAMATALDKKADKAQVETDIQNAIDALYTDILHGVDEYGVTEALSLTGLDSRITLEINSLGDAIDNTKGELLGDAEDGYSDNTIYGAKAYADNAVGAFSEQINPRILAAKTVVNEKSEGHVTVAMTLGGDGNYTYDIAENDIASAQALSGVDKRVENIEKLISEDGNDTINNLTEVIAYFEGVKETETGAGLISTVAGHTTDIADVNGRIDSVAVDLSEGIAYVNAITVNGKALENNPVLNGADIKLDGYATGTAAALEATDTLNTALGKLEARVDAAAAGGVQSVGGKAGSITLDTDAAGEGNVKFAISDTGEISATVNVGASAAQGVNSAEGDALISASFASNKVSVVATEALTTAVANANSAVQTVAEGATNGTIAVDGADVAVHGLGSAAYTEASAYDASGAAATAEANAKAYVDAALCWVEFE